MSSFRPFGELPDHVKDSQRHVLFAFSVGTGVLMALSILATLASMYLIKKEKLNAGKGKKDGEDKLPSDDYRNRKFIVIGWFLILFSIIANAHAVWDLPERQHPYTVAFELIGFGGMVFAYFSGIYISPKYNDNISDLGRTHLWTLFALGAALCAIIVFAFGIALIADQSDPRRWLVWFVFGTKMGVATIITLMGIYNLYHKLQKKPDAHDTKRSKNFWDTIDPKFWIVFTYATSVALVYLYIIFNSFEGVRGLNSLGMRMLELITLFGFLVHGKKKKF